MGPEEKMVIDYLKTSIDNLANKFETFLNKQEIINEKVRENTRDISDLKDAKLISTVAQHETDIKQLKESKEEIFFQRHPILVQILLFGITVILFTILAHFLPGVAHLIGTV